MSTFWLNTWSPVTTRLQEWPLLGFSDVADLALSNFLDYDRSLEAVDQEMKRLRRSMDQNFRQSQRQLASALTNLAARPGSLVEHRSMMNPIQTDAEGNRTLKCCFDMRAFKPEEVDVTLDTKNRCIKVEGKHEVKDDQSRHCIRRHYLRHFYLPEDAGIDFSNLELKSCMNGDGTLCIEAPLPKLPQVEQAKPQEKPPALAEPTPITVKKI